jgi:ABC-type amino acid transport substrate-binding protein
VKHPSKIIIGTVLLFTNLLAACSPKGPALHVKISTSASYMPFEYVDYNKRQLTGFDIDLMNAIGSAVNLEVEFVNNSYGQVLSDVGQCQVDGAIAAIPITNELKTQMNFSTSYFAVGQVVVVKKGNSTITGQDNLSGKTVGVQKNTSGAVEAGKITGIKLDVYSDPQVAFTDLTFGNIDAIITDKILALSYVNKAANDLKIVGKEFAIENYGIAVCTQEKDLLKKINDGLAVIKTNGILDKLIQKWLVDPMIE